MSRPGPAEPVDPAPPASPASPVSALPTLPRGFTVRLAADTRVCGDRRILVGGAGAVLRLKPAARAVLAADGTLVVRDAVSAAVGRLLLDRGLAEPCWSKPATPTAGATTDVTVVVPVRDRPRQLARLLVALAGLSVVVVDDGSLDALATRAVAEEHGARLVRLGTSRGPAAARNVGLRIAHTPLVAFVDSDVVPEPGWLETLRRHLEDPAVAVVGPRVLGQEPTPSDSWLGRYEAARSSLDLGPAPAPVQPLGRVAYLPSAALLGRRSALLEAEHGGFDERLPVAEDVDLVWRLHHAGWRVRYEPGSVVRHDHRTALGPWLVRKAYYGTGAALLAERHGSDVAPMVLTPWTSAVSIALLVQRRWSLPVSGAVAVAVTTRIARRLDEDDHPWRTAASLVSLGLVSTLWQVAAALTRHYWPPVLAACLVSRRARRAVLLAALADGIAEHRRAHPDLDLGRFVLARRLDDLAYGAGLWAGATRARDIRALLPALRGFANRARPGGRETAATGAKPPAATI